jgi:uncharacterized protein YecT (DUF1311 family)
MSKKNYSLAVIATCCLLSLPRLGAQEPDCKKLESNNAESECFSSRLAKSEAEMQRAYKGALAAYTHSPEEYKTLYPEFSESKYDLEHQEETDKRVLRKLRQSQRLWVAYRESACGAIEEKYEGGTIIGEVVPICKDELTKERTKWLEAQFGESSGESKAPKNSQINEPTKR